LAVIQYRELRGWPHAGLRYNNRVKFGVSIILPTWSASVLV